MSFLRSEAVAFLKKWREALIGAGLIGIGVYFATVGLTVQRWIGFALILIGGALIWEGIRRARFPAPGGGPGVVDVDERLITYFGPLGGGSISIDELARVEVRTTDLGPMVSDLFWEFTATDGSFLSIPGDAENAVLIFDALAALPGADYEAATRAAGSTEPASFVIWEKPAHRVH